MLEAYLVPIAIFIVLRILQNQYNKNKSETDNKN